MNQNKMLFIKLSLLFLVLYAIAQVLFRIFIYRMEIAEINIILIVIESVLVAVLWGFFMTKYFKKHGNKKQDE
jgi:hypothetical protein